MANRVCGELGVDELAMWRVGCGELGGGELGGGEMYHSCTQLVRYGFCAVTFLLSSYCYSSRSLQLRLNHASGVCLVSTRSCEAGPRGIYLSQRTGEGWIQPVAM